MFWEEKIDILKKQFPQTDFRDPYTDWPEILKKVEAKFIVKADSNFLYSNWGDQLKNKLRVRTILHQKVNEEIKRLDCKSNYWVVVIQGNYPNSKHLVYDCKTNSLEALISLSLSDFYIIDKKYIWLTFFKIDKENNEITIFKSGNAQTPFD
jgi:hypothetical protein